MPWATAGIAVAEALGVDVERGLSEDEATRRRAQYGPNQLRRHERQSAWSILVEQFKSLIVALLVVAAAVAFFAGEIIEGWAILAVLIINAAIGFVTELRAVRSMEALYAMGRVGTRVRRGGPVREIPAEALVPGDIVEVEGGDVVTADLRIVESSKLQADESALTGESVPVRKEPDPTAPEAVLAERFGMLFKGTAVTRGHGTGVVVATGLDTELGRISSLVEEAEDEATPLEKRLNRLGHKLIFVTLGLAVAVIFSGFLTGKDLVLMIETGIALAVATIPEGLPIVATIVLAKGMRLMARRNALVNRLSSVETLGATGVICTDKTGTLTENRMTVTRLALASGDVEIDGEITLEDDAPLGAALETGVLCNNASFTQDAPDKATGDPLEIALLAAGALAGLDHDALRLRWPEVREEAFDSDVKMMATYHRTDSAYRVAVKGAPEPVLDAATHVLTTGGVEPLGEADRARWLARNDQMAVAGLRVLALAAKTTETPEAEPYRDLVFIGLVGLEDPPREDVRAALSECRRAGVRVVMVTGDQPVTARGVAQAVGLVESAEAEVMHGSLLKPRADLTDAERRQILDTSIFARVSPRQKLDLIDLHQKNGSIVAMTGDGVNDAPALKEADIGVAMGRRGTQVAREAADMVLQDDAFATIVAAIAQGRVIFGNIRRFIYYLMACNVGEVMIVGLAALVSTTLPILPLQILFLNLVTDIFPALALGMGEGEPDVMQQSPRDPKEPILGRVHWQGIVAYGAVFTVAVLGALALALYWLEMPTEQAVTVSFMTLAFAQLWHVFNMRSPQSGLFGNEITRNPYVWGALALCTVMLLAVVYVPGLALVFEVQHPGLSGWLLLLSMSAVPLAAGQVWKVWRGR